MSSSQVLGQLKAGLLTGIQRLDLSCGLTEFPREIFDLADSLEILNLSGNKLSCLPDDLPRLHKLRIIFCSDNLFTELPAVLGQCKSLTMVGFKANQINNVPDAALAPTLRWLILTDNRIQSLPSSIGKCTQMQKLMLAGNQLSGLPAELANCSRLELLRLSANCFSALPPWLLTIPSLAWLAIAGNPLTDSFQAARQAPSIAEVDWQHIELGAKLGEGASGVIYQAKLRQAVTSDMPVEDIAVKLFKSAVTSDGLPRCEMAACIAVGLHPNLVGVMGKIRHHPNGEQGLVMPLIASNYTNLAQPPSLESCTRDIYVQATAFSLQELSRLALGISRAAEHLHACGILHGDLYAHNILYNAEGHGLLGDFGAASFLPIDDIDSAQSLQRIEVRAFGILLGELLAHCAESSAEYADSEQISRSTLTALQQRCTQAHVSARPLFADVVCALNLHMEVASSAS
jgi:Protein tyrosine and serine/threonine kinase/Leucine rich repeat